MFQKITLKNGQFYHTVFSRNQGLTNQTVVSIHQDKKGTFWVGTYGGGVFSFDGQKFMRLEVNMELNDQSVFEIYSDKQGNLWFGSYNNGLEKVTFNTNPFHLYQNLYLFS